MGWKGLILTGAAFLVSTTMVFIASPSFLEILCLLPGLSFFSSKAVIEVIS